MIKCSHASMLLVAVYLGGQSVTSASDPGVISILGSVPGDANGDGKVDLTDFGILKASFGQRGVGLPADFNEDGTVGLFDFGILKSSTQPAGAAAVPEPSTFLLAAWAGVGMLTFRKKRVRSEL